MEKHLRVLNVTLDYPPPVLGGYGVMCAQVCTWLKQRGHEMLVLTRLPPEPGIVSAGQGTEEGAVTVSRTLRSYWDGSANLDPPFQEALAIEQHDHRRLVKGGLYTASAFTLDRQAASIEHWLLAASSSPHT